MGNESVGIVARQSKDVAEFGGAEEIDGRERIRHALLL
jgi:hypothetical protein